MGLFNYTILPLWDGYYWPWPITYTTGSIFCAWCGKDLSAASAVTYLNGNQPVCDLCLLKARSTYGGNAEKEG